MSDAESHSRRSTPVPTFIIDPFFIGPDHVEHYASARIIKVDSIGKVFCPTCLTKTSALDDIMRADDELFDQYINNLFAILDDHCEETQLRRIIIRMLHILLSKRPSRIKDDTELHSVLRIILKVMRSDTFTWNELFPLSRILAIVSTNSIVSNPIPLRSVWSVVKSMLDFAQRKLKKKEKLPSLDEEMAEFIESIPSSINTYLILIGKFSLGKISDLMFPLYLNDTAKTHNQNYYKESQLECLEFVRGPLMHKCWDILTSRNSLERYELSLLDEVFICLDQCLASANRIGDNKFHEFLQRIDVIALSHTLNYRCSDETLRAHVENFLCRYVLHFVQENLGSDPHFDEFKLLDNVVETNHEKAYRASREEAGHRRTIFYFLLNYVAQVHKSRYFNERRLRQVIQLTRPIKLKMLDSIVIMRAHALLLPSISIDSLSIEDEQDNDSFRSIKEVWHRLRRDGKSELFRCIYCYRTDVFIWAHRFTEFKQLVDDDCLNYVLRQSVEQNSTERVIDCILSHPHYREQFELHLSNDDGSVTILQHLIKNSSCQEETTNLTRMNQHDSMIKDMSTLMSSLFYRRLLEYMNGSFETAYLERVVKVVGAINHMISECDHFDFEVPDEHFVDDLFTVLERLYNTDSRQTDCALIIPFNELITLLISHRHPYMMDILAHLEYCVLGLIYERIADYTRDDNLGESIARLLVAYDHIDYPLNHNIESSLILMTHSTVNWMLSQNNDLHALAMKLVERALTTEPSKTKRACIATAFLHMLLTNPNIIKSYSDTIRSILYIDDVIYNPLIPQVIPLLPEDERRAVEDHLEFVNRDCPSPVPSFESSSDNSSIFENHGVVSNIITRLYDVDLHRDAGASRLPGFLYAPCNGNESGPPDTEDWAQRAYQTTQNNNNGN